MDRNQYLLPGIIILVVLVVLVIAFAYSGNNTFKMGTVSFEYPNTWSQENVVGNFSTSALFSQVTLTANLCRLKWCKPTCLYYNSNAAEG